MVRDFNQLHLVQQVHVHLHGRDAADRSCRRAEARESSASVYERASCAMGLQKPVQLTPLIVSDAQVRRGQVDVHVMLEDLLEETLSFS